MEFNFNLAINLVAKSNKIQQYTSFHSKWSYTWRHIWTTKWQHDFVYSLSKWKFNENIFEEKNGPAYYYACSLSIYSWEWENSTSGVLMKAEEEKNVNKSFFEILNSEKKNIKKTKIKTTV